MFSKYETQWRAKYIFNWSTKQTTGKNDGKIILFSVFFVILVRTVEDFRNGFFCHVRCLLKSITSLLSFLSRWAADLSVLRLKQMQTNHNKLSWAFTLSRDKLLKTWLAFFQRLLAMLFCPFYESISNDCQISWLAEISNIISIIPLFILRIRLFHFSHFSCKLSFSIISLEICRR